jgi:hypothetical protein
MHHRPLFVSASVAGWALGPGSQMPLAGTYMKMTERQMLMARLGSIAMVAIVREMRVGRPLRDAGRETLRNRGFGRAECWPKRWSDSDREYEGGYVE